MTAPQQFLTETRERFLKALLTSLPAERIRELYLFQPIRQGGVESGVAVVAAYQVEDSSAVDRRPSAVPAETTSEPAESTGEVDPADNASCALPVVSEGTADGRRPTADAVPEKYIVYTARYRHTLKGPDRGKWESSIVAEADAPLLSIESVVRGVQRRSGDVDPPDHMSAAELRAALRLESEGAA